MRQRYPLIGLGEIASFSNGKSLKKAEYDDNGAYPVYGSNGIIAHSNSKRFDDGVVVIGRVGAFCGSLFFSNGPAWVTDNAIVAQGHNGVDSRFLYYLLHVLKLNRTAIGSAQPLLTQAGLNVLKVTLPPDRDRNEISKLLSSLDDKIENNRAMNETLEEMARAIFKSWFVDFDPVHAKSRGEQPAHMDAETAALFPDRFGDDGLPEGWQQAPVSHFAKIKGGKQLTKTSFVDNGPFPVFGGAGIMGRTDQYNAEGFVITVGRVGAYCGQFFSHRGKAWVNNNASHIIPHDNISGEWLITSLRAIDLNPIKKGAAQPFVSNSDISALLLTNPGKDTLRIFADTAHILRLKIENNDVENRTLAELRDTLLPKLMSGEIRIKDAEREVGAAV